MFQCDTWLVYYWDPWFRNFFSCFTLPILLPTFGMLLLLLPTLPFFWSCIPNPPFSLFFPALIYSIYMRLYHDNDSNPKLHFTVFLYEIRLRHFRWNPWEYNPDFLMWNIGNGKYLFSRSFLKNSIATRYISRISIKLTTQQVSWIIKKEINRNKPKKNLKPIFQAITIFSGNLYQKRQHKMNKQFPK